PADQRASCKLEAGVAKRSYLTDQTRSREGALVSEAPGRRRSRVPMALGIFVGVVLLVVVGGAIALRTLLSPERLRTQVIHVTAAKFGAEPDLKTIRLTFVPLGIRLEGFSLPGVEPGDPPLFTFESAHARVRPFPLLARALIIDEIKVV